MSWFGAFAVTQLVEMPIHARALLRRRDASDGSSASSDRALRFVAAFGASALTHPVVWFVLPKLQRALGYWGYVAVAETFAVVAEAAYLCAWSASRAPRDGDALSFSRALVWSFAANAASVVVGLSMRALWGFP